MRFEIQEIVNQTENGITYLATDRDTGRNVALRRFFPNGRDQDGLDAAAKEQYLQICERLSNASHPALRSVTNGFIDPLDDIPCMATEWIEADPLPLALKGQTMEPARIIELVRNAIEVSMVLSAAMGEEAVWIETTDRSVLVDPNSSNREFTFWVCPFRCLKLNQTSIGIDSIARLAEELAGWKSRLYSKQAGKGLGGWIKTMKQAPDTALGVALDALPKTTAEPLPTPMPVARPVAMPIPIPAPLPIAAPRPLPAPVRPPIPKSIPTSQPSLASVPVIADTKQLQPTPGKSTTQIGQQPVLKSAESGTSWMKITFPAAAAVLVFGLVALQLWPDHGQPELAASIPPETKHTDAVAGSAPEPVIESEAVATAKTTEPKSNLPANKPDNVVAGIGTPSKPKKQPKSSVVVTYHVYEVEKINGLENGAKVKIRGTLKQVNYGRANKSISVTFAGPKETPLTGAFALKDSFKGNFNTESFSPFIGKEVVIHGDCLKRRANTPSAVQFHGMDAIKIAEK